MRAPELAISAVTTTELDWIGDDSSGRAVRWMTILDDPVLAEWLAPFPPTFLYFGSEFCEHLLPSRRTLAAALTSAARTNLNLVLMTPIASPQVIRQLAELVPLLPESAEIIVNDWGVAHFLAEHHPTQRRIAGRILCRMIKDPRLTGVDWAHQCTHGLDSGPLQAILDRLGLEQVEMDVPMFADAELFSRLPMPKGVHLPFSYVAKGRMCRPGSLSISGPERFAVGRKCKKECLNFSATTRRPGASDRWDTVHVGNTIFSRHSREMRDAVIQATEAGTIERLIVPARAL